MEGQNKTEVGEHYPGPPRASADRIPLWFDESVVVPDEFRDLLVQYSHIPPDDVNEHVIRVVSMAWVHKPEDDEAERRLTEPQRNRAWQVHPYPCLGQFRFLELNLSHRPGDIYARLLALLKESSTSGKVVFLDVGSCLGQDVRKLIHDGAPSFAVAGADISSTLLEQGYELFRDSPQTVKMVEANILSPLTDEGPLAAWRGQLKAVQLGMILHLFDWEEQVTAFANAIALLNDHEGVSVFGQATGNLDGRETRTLSPGGVERKTWKHNVNTFEKLIKDVEQRTGTRWIVHAELDEALSVNDGKRTWDDPKTRRLLFEIQRIKSP